jgi:hypothetical protein
MVNKVTNQQKELAQTLLLRLEKISADSTWSHQASGIRASIAKMITKEEHNPGSVPSQNLEEVLELGFNILEGAASEIPED